MNRACLKGEYHFHPIRYRLLTNKSHPIANATCMIGQKSRLDKNAVQICVRPLIFTVQIFRGSEMHVSGSKFWTGEASIKRRNGPLHMHGAKFKGPLCMMVRTGMDIAFSLLLLCALNSNTYV